jgi:hypothetical protein
MSVNTATPLDRVLIDIVYGALDEHLNEIRNVVEARLKEIQEQTFQSLSVGDRIRINNSARPLYLRGATGVIVKINRTKVTINLDSPAGRFYRGVVTPVSLLEVI